MDNRGVILHRDRARQILNFANLRHGNITPTDIDGMIEYHNICYVYIEVKYMDAEMPNGQRLALERQNDDMQKTKPSITIVSTHNVSNPEDDVDVASTTVTQFRFMYRWHIPKTVTTTMELVTRFINWAELKQIEGGE